jgi:hypothetical protein
LPAPPAPASRSNEGIGTLKGGQEGTVFHDLTVEGEDRVHVEFERPALEIDLDSEKAPGLTWGNARDVLDRTAPDLLAPLLAMSASAPCPHLARPWLSGFRSGSVAQFRPAVEGVERWRLLVANSRGETVTTFTGNGRPPRTLEWNGRDRGGRPVAPGLTYSYAFEAYDRAGNKRNFVGEGFVVPAYRLVTGDGPMLLFSGRALGDLSPGDRGGFAPARGVVGAGEGEERSAARLGAIPVLLLEAASWLNQSERGSRPLVISVTARSFDEASRLGQAVSAALVPLLLGDPSRVRAVTLVQPDAPEGGSVVIGGGR